MNIEAVASGVCILDSEGLDLIGFNAAFISNGCFCDTTTEM
jgi:hypothetical protein